MTTLACDPILFHNFLPQAIGAGIHSLGYQTIRAALVTTVPVMQTNLFLSSLTQVADGNGYSAGGVTCVVEQPDTTGGIYRLIISEIPTWFGEGVGFDHIGLVFYNDSSTSKNLIAAVFEAGAGQQSVTNVSQTGNTATLTVAGHGYANDDIVVIDGMPPPALNGTFVIANTTTNTFDITSMVSETITSQDVPLGRVIRPETVTVDPGDSYIVTPDPINGVFAVGPMGVNL